MPLRTRRVSALLGPTNTGKTYRAIQRMLEHPTGMFGLPLRLLAREVYDKVVAATGPDQVALVTGEEKILPPGARYWICTVEAMPVGRRVAFVAVDEIQLAGDRQRGHVFTDRLLNCRGLDQTVFLGSDTIESLLQELIPGIEIERAERFSTLSMAGPHRIQGLPKRSALVAFSMERVYELAEAVKRAHGGTAVVLGALSPRTRNAQVELYQSGEVNHLVATDAIGMGLNLDLHHVTLEAVRKFDGRTFRDLTPAEVGQIAGRAGRYRTAGTFGALRPLELDAELVEAVEAHRFAPVRRLYWRNSALDFASVETLLTSLERRPPHRLLMGVRGEDDQHVLATLQRDPDVMKRIDGPEQVQRLWDVCQVPDFRKTLTDAHVRLLRDLALHLTGPRGRLPVRWVEERLARLDRVDGDIETLMGRLAWIRTWTYVTFRGDWIDGAQGWQQRTRAIEDRLSDALHRSLTERFVDRQALHVATGGDVTVVDGEVRLAGLSLGRLEGLVFVPAPEVGGRALRRALASLADAVAAQTDRLETAPDDALALDDEHQVVWEGTPLARLDPGPDVFEPVVRLHRLELLDGAQKDRVRVRIARWVRGTVDRLLGALRHQGDLPPTVRGLLYAIERGMGTVPAAEHRAAVRALTDAERKDLARRGVRLGRTSLYVTRTLKPAMVRIRARLWSIAHGIQPSRAVPPPSATARTADGDEAFWWAIGFPVVGGVAVRADVLETCAAELRREARDGPFALPERIVSRLAVDEDTARAFVRGLGYRDDDGRFRARERRRRRR